MTSEQLNEIPIGELIPDTVDTSLFMKYCEFYSTRTILIPYQYITRCGYWLYLKFIIVYPGKPINGVILGRFERSSNVYGPR